MPSLGECECGWNYLLVVLNHDERRVHLRQESECYLYHQFVFLKLKSPTKIVTFGLLLIFTCSRPFLNL